VRFQRIFGCGVLMIIVLVVERLPTFGTHLMNLVFVQGPFQIIAASQVVHHTTRDSHISVFFFFVAAEQRQSLRRGSEEHCKNESEVLHCQGDTFFSISNVERMLRVLCAARCSEREVYALIV